MSNGVVLNKPVTITEAVATVQKVVKVCAEADISYKLYSDRRRRKYLISAFGLDGERLARAFPDITLSVKDNKDNGKSELVAKIYLNY